MDHHHDVGVQALEGRRSTSVRAGRSPARRSAINPSRVTRPPPDPPWAAPPCGPAWTPGGGQPRLTSPNTWRTDPSSSNHAGSNRTASNTRRAAADRDGQAASTPSTRSASRAQSASCAHSSQARAWATSSNNSTVAVIARPSHGPPWAGWRTPRRQELQRGLRWWASQLPTSSPAGHEKTPCPSERGFEKGGPNWT